MDNGHFEGFFFFWGGGGGGEVWQHKNQIKNSIKNTEIWGGEGGGALE